MAVMSIYVCLYVLTHTYLYFIMFHCNQFMHTIIEIILQSLLGQVRSNGDS